MNESDKNNEVTAPSDTLTFPDEPVSNTDLLLRKERYRLFVEQFSYGFFEIDTEGTLTFFNDALCKILGRSRDELDQQKITEFMSQEDADEVHRNLELIGSIDKPVRRTWRILHKTGKDRTIEVSIQPTFDNRNDHYGYRGIARDVTNKMRTLEVLIKSRKKIQELYTTSQEAERRYRAFLEFLPLPLLVQGLDYRVEYINPAFQDSFGWTMADYEQNPFAHIPPEISRPNQSPDGTDLFQTGAFHNFETQIISKDGNYLEVVADSATFYDQDEKPAGYIVTIRDITKPKKDERTTSSLFKIAEALHHYNDLDSLLSFIARQVQSLLRSEYTHIILVDYKHEEYYFRVDLLHDPETFRGLSKTRIPLSDDFFVGKVILSGRPRIVNDASSEYTRLIPVDKDTKTILGVPLKLKDRIIGAMVTTNKLSGSFIDDDAALLSTIANMVSLPVENARINAELRKSYENIQSLNRAKDRIIDHLSHELRTPLAVLSASLGMLMSETPPDDPETVNRLLKRSKRNLNRLTEIQSKIVDITQNPDEPAHRTFSALLELCQDELEVYAGVEVGAGQELIRKIRERFNRSFSAVNQKPDTIDLATFTREHINRISPHFSKRSIRFAYEIEPDAGTVFMPREALAKTITGLLKNAIEYTPDGGLITVIVRKSLESPELLIKDTGIGITKENQRLIFGNYFTTADVSSYRTETPYSFDAGGSGFDLLRIQVFAERFHFRISISSKRCKYIPTNEDKCPGVISKCEYCSSADDCYATGGTCFSIHFSEQDIHNILDKTHQLPTKGNQEIT